MKKFSLLLFISLSLISANSFAQDDTLQVNKIADQVSLGLGMGQMYGGFGANLLAYPHENIGLFGGVGHAIAGVGYNIGTKVRFFSKNPRTNFYLVGMYGYNAAVKVSGANEYNKLFFGPTVGLGIDTGKRSYKKGYWTMALLFPIRSSDVNNYMDDLEDNNGVEFKSGLFPITFSIGYQFSLD